MNKRLTFHLIGNVVRMAGALMALSLTGSGVGMLVLFRTSRRWKANLAILLCVYLTGVLIGHFTGFLVG